MAYQLELAHFVSGLDRIESLLRTEGKAASGLARALLADIEKAVGLRLPTEPVGAPLYAARSDAFRREWDKGRGEGAASLCGLMRWRLLVILADLTGELDRYYEAALARPDLGVSRAALGCALARAGKFAAAVTHLCLAVTADPLDRQAARAYFGALGQNGQADEQRRFAAIQRQLARSTPEKVAKEDWFEKCPWAGDELVSIVMLCSNQLEITRLCLDSVFRHTRRPYELIVVDNGSTDGTPAYLEGLRLAGGQPAPRVVVVRNESNLGFPKGCNQGLAEARGDYLVLLNNDTVVTEGWAEGLVRLLLFDWPHTGMVGPVTNGAPPPQYVAETSETLKTSSLWRDDRGAFLAEVDRIAAKCRREFKGQALNTERITGFCLAIRRDVLETVGGKLDEGYGLGYFEDDDLCVRVRNAGFRPAVALDVFIYHFGTLTYAGLGIDSRKLMLEGFERFKEKWGEERAKGYHLPGPRPHEPVETEATESDKPVAAFAKDAEEGRTTAKARVTVAIIAKNEEANLGDCLVSVADLAAEIVVVDTGSTDRTREIALGYGAKVFEFPWVDSFAAARNECLRHATGQWIFWMDADDRLDDENRDKLRVLFNGLGNENAAFVMKCLCLKKTPEGVTPTGTEVDHVRLFHHHPDLRWQYRVHEQISACSQATWGQGALE